MFLYLFFYLFAYVHLSLQIVVSVCWKSIITVSNAQLCETYYVTTKFHVTSESAVIYMATSIKSIFSLCSLFTYSVRTNWVVAFHGWIIILVFVSCDPMRYHFMFFFNWNEIEFPSLLMEFLWYLQFPVNVHFDVEYNSHVNLLLLIVWLSTVQSTWQSHFSFETKILSKVIDAQTNTFRQQLTTYVLCVFSTTND